MIGSLANIFKVRKEVGNRWGEGVKVLLAAPSRLPSPLAVYLQQVRASQNFTPPQIPGKEINHPRAPSCSSSFLTIKPCRPLFSSSACKALTQVTEKEGSSCGEESSSVGPAIPIRARVSLPPAQAPGGQLCRFGFQGACAHARRGAARTRSRRAALSARHQIGNKTLIGLRVSCSQS